MSTWMVVEDEPDLYDTLLALFEIWSIDGIAFTDGSDAIEWIDEYDRGSASVSKPELAILDIRLPGVSGPEIAHRLRRSPILKDIAVVLTTAYSLSPQQEREVIARADADMLMYKPLPAPLEFRAQLQTAIAKRRKR